MSSVDALSPLAAPPQPMKAEEVGQDSASVLKVSGLGFRYGDRAALEDINLSVAEGEMFALLGPNGSGKSTLLRILATLYRPTTGKAEVEGLDIVSDPAGVRRKLGVVFQTPGLDGKLSVKENLRFQGYLYGLSGSRLKKRIDELLERFKLRERHKDKVETLSGGLQRRVELAKSLLHDPPILLLDEPSTGLDLSARHTLWRTLDELREDGKLTVILTTHLMEEAERCGRVALLDEGRLVAMDEPAALRRRVGETVITLESENLSGLAERISARFGIQPTLRDGQLRLNDTDASMAQRLLAEFSDDISALRLGRPTLGDVFLTLTGHDFFGEDAPNDDNGGRP